MDGGDLEVQDCAAAPGVPGPEGAGLGAPDHRGLPSHRFRWRGEAPGGVLMFGGQMPIIRVGRMAGQFAKPRSAPFEERDGVKLPSYKGDNINGDAFNEKSRIPDPQRLIRAYCQSAATLNLLRAFATGGYAAMQRISEWNLDFAEHSEQGDRYAFLNLSWFHFSTLNVSLSSFSFWYLTIFNEPGSLRENLKHSLERVYPKNRRKDIIVLVHSLVFCEYHAY
ncbi:uncharacterized protein LOC121262134 [Juglans microcarpa x Juglans regia]|uniref:uncharacterized protein LOC121262134 n=1 Tax=Juglans microcarpa x Juglans regia TaxID=2249226 RepID=UPI001B7DCC04|nr:uncharacterized protein LOC121262134 [Juglans microcarpa x Juglans regia]